LASFENYIDKKFSEEDLDEICLRLNSNLSIFRDAEVTILGGSGFIGSWLLSSLIRCNQTLNLNMRINSVTRHGNYKYGLTPGKGFFHYSHDTSEKFPRNFPSGDFYVSGSNSSKQALNYESIFKGNANLQDFLIIRKSKAVVLNLSSGAVYSQKINNSPSKINDDLNQNQEFTSYSYQKIESEKLITNLEKRSNAIGINARLFAFAGPGIPLKEHFAIGNFLNNVLNNEEVHINGHPDTFRSYMYPTDMVVWLIKGMMVKKTFNFNVGSDEQLSISQIARIVIGNSPINLRVESSQAAVATYYYPEISESLKLLKESKIIKLSESIERWSRWITS
jgi:dTDP-glucose 4,6-dehydratase